MAPPRYSFREALPSLVSHEKSEVRFSGIENNKLDQFEEDCIRDFQEEQGHNSSYYHMDSSFNQQWPFLAEAELVEPENWYPSLKDLDERALVRVKNKETEMWLSHVEDDMMCDFDPKLLQGDMKRTWNDVGSTLLDRNAIDPRLQDVDEGVGIHPVSDDESVHENRLQEGQTYFNVNANHNNEAYKEVTIQSRHWNDMPEYPYATNTVLQPQTAVAAVARYNEMADNCSLLSRTATWGSRRGSEASLVDTELVNDGSFLGWVSLSKHKESQNSVAGHLDDPSHQLTPIGAKIERETTSSTMTFPRNGRLHRPLDNINRENKNQDVGNLEERKDLADRDMKIEVDQSDIPFVHARYSNVFQEINPGMITSAVEQFPQPGASSPDLLTALCDEPLYHNMSSFNKFVDPQSHTEDQPAVFFQRYISGSNENSNPMDYQSPAYLPRKLSTPGQGGVVGPYMNPLPSVPGRRGRAPQACLCTSPTRSEDKMIVSKRKRYVSRTPQVSTHYSNDPPTWKENSLYMPYSHIQSNRQSPIINTTEAYPEYLVQAPLKLPSMKQFNEAIKRESLHDGLMNPYSMGYAAMTGIDIPVSQVCGLPMSKFESWTSEDSGYYTGPDTQELTRELPQQLPPLADQSYLPRALPQGNENVLREYENLTAELSTSILGKASPYFSHSQDDESELTYETETESNDEECQSAKSPLSSLPSKLSGRKEVVFNEIMTLFWNIYNKDFSTIVPGCIGSVTTCTASGSGSNSSTQSQSTPSGITSSMPSSSSRSSVKRKAPSDNDEFPPDDRRQGPRQPNGHSTPAADQRSASRFACPFRKQNPQKYNMQHRKWNRCATSSFESVARTKCWIFFQSQDDLNIHLSAVSICEVRNGQPDCGITPDMVSRLKSRKRSAKDQTEEDRWRTMYTMLFPDEEMPSPCVPIEEFMRQQLPQFLSRRLEVAILHTDLNEDTDPLNRDQLRELFDTLIPILVNEAVGDASCAYRQISPGDTHLPNLGPTPPPSSMNDLSQTPLHIASHTTPQPGNDSMSALKPVATPSSQYSQHANTPILGSELNKIHSCRTVQLNNTSCDLSMIDTHKSPKATIQSAEFGTSDDIFAQLQDNNNAEPQYSTIDCSSLFDWDAAAFEQTYDDNAYDNIYDNDWGAIDRAA